MIKHFRILLALAIVASSIDGADAQRRLWGGLDAPQTADQLPVGRAAFVPSRRVAKSPSRPSTLASAAPASGFAITGGWELADGRTVSGIARASGDIHSLDFVPSADWFDAVVPGTVLTTLVENGVYPDPYYGLNNLHIPDSLARTDWWYRTVFTAPASETGRVRTWLLMDGINYRAEVFLNGRRVGEVAGAFIRGRIDVTDIIADGALNVLVVHILPPDHPGIPHEQTIAAGQGLNGGALSLDGPTFISSVGWDWIPGIRDRNIGIWQPVRLVATSDVALGDPFVIADLPLPDTTSVRLCVSVPLYNSSDVPARGEIEVDIAGNLTSIPYSLAAGERLTYSACTELRNPRLWWPNGYGAPELYTASFVVKNGGVVSDSRTVRFGIREFSYELMVQLPDGSHRRMLHTPTDATENTPPFDYVERGRFAPQIQLPTLKGVSDMASVPDFMRAHGLSPLPDDDPVGPYFAIRVNGRRVFCRGGNWGMDDGMKRVSRARLEPYMRLHREAGFNMIRNWTGESTEEAFYDLCDEYGIMVWNDFWITTDDTVEPLDPDLFMANATDAVRRFRNHPSIAVWCPRNEGFAPRNLEQSLPDMMAAEDPSRHYHGQSRYLNMDTSGPWSYFDDPSLYYTRNARGFITEIGAFAIPTAASIRKFLAPEDRWPMNDVWAYHDMHHTSQNFAGFMKATGRYGAPDSMEDFERKAQFVCYDSWRAIIESWNSRMWNTTTGQLLWMSHPAWPSFIWQTHTWDYQTPGSWFGARKASEPLHVQFNLGDSTVMVVNNTRRDMQGLVARVSFIDPLSGRVMASSSRPVNAPAASATTVGEGSGFAKAPLHAPALYILRTELLDGMRTLSINDYWRAATDESYKKVNDIPAVRLRITRRGDRVTVKNTSRMAPALNVKLDAIDSRSGQEILPAIFSDGYFNLLPGEERTLTLRLPDGAQKHNITATGYNVQN